MIDDIILDFKNELQSINSKLDNLSINSDKIEILNATQVMKILGINRNTANELFKRADFPRIKGLKSYKVEKTALLKWLSNNMP